MTLRAHDDIIRLAREGWPRTQIAHQTGCTLDQVYHRISRARQKGEDIPKAAKGWKRSADLRAVMLTKRFRDELFAAASARGLKPHELAARLLAIAIDEDLIDGILDDADEIVAVTETPKHEEVPS